jgi:uncharacterized protein (TIGR00369 family)
MPEYTSMSVVPFHELVGIEVIAGHGGSACVRAPDSPQLKNHFGTMHGGMIFTLGEVAAAVSITRLLGERLSDFRAITQGATIRFLKPARGAITARGRVGMTSEEIIRASQSQPSITVPIAVALEDDAGVTVATLQVEWFVARKSRVC